MTWQVKRLRAIAARKALMMASSAEIDLNNISIAIHGEETLAFFLPAFYINLIVRQPRLQRFYLRRSLDVTLPRTIDRLLPRRDVSDLLSRQLRR